MIRPIAPALNRLRHGTERRVIATLRHHCHESKQCSRASPWDTRPGLKPAPHAVHMSLSGTKPRAEPACAPVRQMRAARLHPDGVLWNALITAAGRAGQLQRAFQTLEEMQARTRACVCLTGLTAWRRSCTHLLNMQPLSWSAHRGSPPEIAFVTSLGSLNKGFQSA